VIVSTLVSFVDSEAFVASARTIWTTARDHARGRRVEIYAKISVRRRVARIANGERPFIFETAESGTALRLAGGGGPGAFAATPGTSKTATRSLLALVDRAPQTDDGAMPPPRGVGEPLRTDLDPGVPLPERERIAEALRGAAAGWIECGSTLEVLVGDDGWVAARRRNRTWGLRAGDRPTLFAARGFDALESGSFLQTDDPAEVRGEAGDDRVVLRPRAAATLVAALAAALHGAEGGAPPAPGPGWVLADEPEHPLGVSGGEFDDAGFGTRRRELAAGGRFLDRLEGPGTYRRPSFRDMPRPAASTLVLPDGTPEAGWGRGFERCRVIPIERDEWLLELGGRAGPDEVCFARMAPKLLIERCVAGRGPARIGAEGVLTPALVFEMKTHDMGGS
jgi:hypothetical protein